MRFLVCILSLLSFFLVKSAYAYQVSQGDVVFIREYREYGWKKYGADGVKLLHPIQLLVDFYLVEYRLDATHLTITKMSAAHPSARTILATTSLSQTQRQAMQQGLRKANPSLIEQQCNSNPVIVDDGFHLAVTLTKSTASRTFNWNGNYVPELMAFLEVVNEASPKKYRFYELGQQEAFKQSLLHVTNAP